jgi:hypothetical protein
LPHAPPPPPPHQVTLDADDVILCEVHIDHGKQRANPMAAVRFYQTADADAGDEPFAMPQQQVSSMLATSYQGERACARVCVRARVCVCVCV